MLRALTQGSGSGFGSVTQIDTGTGLTGGPITTSGTISIADSDINSLAGYDNSGIFSTVTVGSGLSLSAGTLTASGGGSPAFSDITNGTNTAATMVVGTGAALTASGSGTITATAVPVGGISGLGTGVATALAINVGSIGAPVILNGAGGTPSSMTGTNITGTAAGLTAGSVTVADAGGDATTWVLLGTSQTGALTPATDSGLTYNATTDALTATTFAGALTGNSSTATALATARAIGGVNFDGTADITPTQIQPASETSDTTCFPLFVNAASGTAQQPKYHSTFGYNASANALTATTFIGALTGNADTATNVAVGGITGLGTGVATALAVNVGSAGAPVVNGGALGTPSSGTATNLTGTASGLTAGNVTTNANLTGVITSVGNATSIASQTGTGTKFVVDTSPTLVTPNIGVATGTSLAASGVLTSGANSGTQGSLKLFGSTSGDVTIKTAAAAGTATIFQLPADNGTNTYLLQTNGSGVTSWVPAPSGGAVAFSDLTSGTNTTAAMVVGTGGSIAASGSGTITATAIAVGGITGLGTGVATFLATPSSANLASAITDETGSGALVFATSPALTTPNIGVATATSVNKMAITAPATSSTLAVADGKTLTASNTVTLTGTDGVSMNVSNNKIRSCGFSVTSPTVAQQGTYYVCPVDGTITAWNIVVDAGTATVKVWKIATGTAAPTSSNSINTSGVAISTGTAIRSTTVTDFTTTTVTANDIFGFEITAVSGATKLDFQLEITAT